MKRRICNVLSTVLMFLIPTINYAQAPTLGTAANFVFFSTNGAVSNTGISQITGNVGTNNGSSTAFGNVNGGMHDMDGTSAQCAADLLIAYNQLFATIPTFFPGNLLGNGATLTAGVYSISGATSLNLDLTLDAQNNAGAEFIFKIGGAFSTNANSKIKLINGAQACNVYWKVEGLVDMATGTTMRGTVIANNFAIILNTGDTLEGRALSTTGAVTVHGVFAYTPIGCGSPVLLGPVAPDLGAAACYAIFSAAGAVSNTGDTYITGDVGSNTSSPTGFNPLLITGNIHLLPDFSTAQSAADLLIAYTYLNNLPVDIELLYPAQFGNDLVLTPHTYLMNAAAALTDSVILNAEGNIDAVFVIKINGALTTGTYSRVKLINGAKAKNVYWLVEGAVSINNYSEFRGTLVVNNGALGAINTGVIFEGRALTTGGALTTAAVSVVATLLPTNCGTVSIATFDADLAKPAITIYPNPTTGITNFAMNGLKGYTKLAIYTLDNKRVYEYNISGKTIAQLNLSALPKGMYMIRITDGQTIYISKLLRQ
jgi:hypothetical protein